jgi:hypothetical protein
MYILNLGLLASTCNKVTNISLQAIHVYWIMCILGLQSSWGITWVRSSWSPSVHILTRLCPHFRERAVSSHACPEDAVYSLNDSSSCFTQRLFPMSGFSPMYNEYLIIIHGDGTHSYCTSHSYVHSHPHIIHHIHVYIHIFIPSFLLIFVAGWLPSTLCVRYNYEWLHSTVAYVSGSLFAWNCLTKRSKIVQKAIPRKSLSNKRF